jgi:hypothetical protein
MLGAEEALQRTMVGWLSSNSSLLEQLPARSTTHTSSELFSLGLGQNPLFVFALKWSQIHR